jgi:hypothetical protein
MGGQSVTTREAAHSRKIVYGRARIGGNIVYLESTGSDNKYLWFEGRTKLPAPRAKEVARNST